MSAREYNNRHSEKGFTLIELLIVMSVLVTLMSMIFVIAPNLTDRDIDHARADIRLLMLALYDYARENGGAYPPNELPEGVEMLPYGGEGEKLQWEKETSAALFYFTTRQFYFKGSQDPQYIGKKKLGGNGPFLDIDNLTKRNLAEPNLLRDDDILVDLGKTGYTGNTTWLKDPWGNPYKYIALDNQRRFVIESAGPDGKFGAAEDEFATEQEKENGRDNIRSDSLSR